MTVAKEGNIRSEWTGVHCGSFLSNNHFGGRPVRTMGFFEIMQEQYRIIEQRRKFFRSHGYRLGLDNPMTYNEKIMWRKIFDRNPLFPKLSDKLCARSYVLEKLGQTEGEAILVPLLFATQDPAEIPFEDLPEEYIVKPNHGSGWSIIVDRERQVPRERIISQCRKWLKRTYGQKKMEWAYSGIKPCIMVEKLLKDNRGRLAPDFKFYVFNGTTGMVYVLYDRFGSPTEAFYDRGFKRLRVNTSFPDGPEIREPENFGKMIEISEKLASELDFLRVDLYDVDGRIFFGEFTLYPASGMYRYAPLGFERKLGEHWPLNREYSRDFRPWF